MKRGGTLGVLVGFALLAAAGVGFRLWQRADRAWLLPPPPGRWAFIIRVDGTRYHEGLATRLALDFDTAVGPRTSTFDVGASDRPLRRWVTHTFAPTAGDDGDALLAAVLKKVEARLAKDPYRWKIAWIDDQGRRVIVSGPADR